MIDRERLKGMFGEREALEKYNDIKAENDFAGFCKAFMYDEDYQVARNTFWILTKATDEELSQLQGMLEELMELAMAASNSSVRRLCLNVIARLKITEDDLRTDFLDFCLEHMVAMDEFPGIQSLCMKLAYRQCSFYPELMAELLRIVEAMEIDYYKPAVKCVRNKILRNRPLSDPLPPLVLNDF